MAGPDSEWGMRRYYGGSRFDSGAVVGEEWSHFGGHFFLLPRLELVSSTRGSGNGVGEVRHVRQIAHLECIQRRISSASSDGSRGDGQRGMFGFDSAKSPSTLILRRGRGIYFEIALKTRSNVGIFSCLLSPDTCLVFLLCRHLDLGGILAIRC
jgi:hypothetical protein